MKFQQSPAQHMQHQHGQSAVEYAIGMGALVLVMLAAPDPLLDVLAGLKAFWTNYSYLMSLP